MLAKLGAGIYRGFFWIYDRGTWQYDVMVILILCFIFLTPREWFRDQPATPPRQADIVLLRNSPEQKVYQLRATLIDPKTDGTVARGAQRVLQIHTGRAVHVLRVEPAGVDAQGQVNSYDVWVGE